MKHPSSEIQSSSVITSGTFNKTAGVDFSVNNLNFDGNGNILTMDQKGLKINTSSYIDRLTYTYQNNSNKLAQVTDAANDKNSKLGDFKYDPATKGSIDYGYDANGNLLSDANKNITNITYNYLNLPAAITVAGKGTINYTYDAAGNKLRKETTDNTINPARTTTTLYSNGLVYENDTLQYIAHEEGRIRPVRDASNNITNFTYDYFLKDHLGNVRMVLTEEQKTDAYPPASMETAQSTIENHFYSNINTTRIAKPAGYPTDTYTNPNDYVAKVRGDGNKIGPAIVLKVMVGDKFNLRCNSWWNSGSAPGTPVSPLNDLLSALAGSIGNISDGHGGATATEITNSGVLTPGVSNFLNSQSYNSSKPKAYINWILFDEQFKFVSSSSGFEQVGSNEEFKTHLFNDIAINKNGYLYVYVSNETPNIDVFFDNLQVTHTRGALLSEDHYYPFGLQMQGISSKALNFGNPENKKKYQQYEFNSDFDINLYESFYRTHDPQLGRFWQIDPKPTDMESLYAAMGNNPIKNTDLLGDTTIFYSSTGVELLRTTENSKSLGNVVTFISDDKLQSFNDYKNTISDGGKGDLSATCSVSLLRNQGESYDVKGTFDFMDANSKNNPNTQTDIWKPTDGKGPLINEQSAAMEKKNGVWSPNPAKTDKSPGSPFSVSLQGSGVTMHTHENEGRKFTQTWKGETKNGTVLSGKAALGGDGDVSNAQNQPGTGLLQMAVGKKSIYFYNTSGVVLTINKDVFNPKYFKK